MENQQQHPTDIMDLAVGTKLPRAAGPDPTTLTPAASSRAPIQPEIQASDLGEAIKALGKDISVKMEEFSRRPTSLKSRPADKSTVHRPVDTSTLAP